MRLRRRAIQIHVYFTLLTNSLDIIFTLFNCTTVDGSISNNTCVGLNKELAKQIDKAIQFTNMHKL